MPRSCKVISAIPDPERYAQYVYPVLPRYCAIPGNIPSAYSMSDDMGRNTGINIYYCHGGEGQYGGILHEWATYFTSRRRVKYSTRVQCPTILPFTPCNDRFIIYFSLLCRWNRLEFSLLLHAITPLIPCSEVTLRLLESTT